MENREEFILQSVTRLQSIQTLEEYKAAKEDIIGIMENLFKTGGEELTYFVENMFTMSPEEREERSRLFQDDNYLLDPRIGVEMERLDNIPGVLDLADEFEKELEVRIAPFMEQYGEQMNKLMDNLMGTMVDGLAEAFSPMAEVAKEETEEEFVFDYDNPDTPEMLYDLYVSRTLEELEENKDYLYENMEEQLQSDIWDLEILTDPGFTDKQEEDIKKIEKILHRMKRFKPEIEKEFARLAALPDAAEKVEEIQKEIMNRFNPKIREIKMHLAKPWRK